MRPNIDIEPSINGKVQEYADASGMSLKESYKEIIKLGLKHTSMPASEEARNKVLHGGSLDRIRFTPTDRGVGVPVVTFDRGFLSGATPPLVIKTTQRGMSGVNGLEQLGDALAQVAPCLAGDGESASWGIRQPGGLWYGEGVADYYTALEKQTERHERLPLDERQHGGAATLVCSLSIPSDAYLIIDSQPGDGEIGTMGGDRTRYFNLNFIAEGTPIGSAGDRIEQVAEAFGRKVRLATPLSGYFHAGGASGISINEEDIVEWDEQESEHQPNAIKKIIVNNPFKKSASNRFESNLQYIPVKENERRKEAELTEQFTEILQPDQILCHVKGRPDVDMDISSYDVSRVDFWTDLSVVGGHGFANLSVEVKPRR